MLANVYVTSLSKIKVVEGDVYHVIKQSSDGFTGFGEAYFSGIDYQKVKGWRKHHQMTLNLVVPLGKVRFTIYDDNKNSKTFGKFKSFILSLDNYSRLTIPPGLWLAFEGLAKPGSLVLNIADIEHCPDESVKRDLSDIPYPHYEYANTEGLLL